MLFTLLTDSWLELSTLDDLVVVMKEDSVVVCFVNGGYVTDESTTFLGDLGLWD